MQDLGLYNRQVLICHKIPTNHLIKKSLEIAPLKIVIKNYLKNVFLERRGKTLSKLTEETLLKRFQNCLSFDKLVFCKKDIQKVIIFFLLEIIFESPKSFLKESPRGGGKPAAV